MGLSKNRNRSVKSRNRSVKSRSVKSRSRGLKSRNKNRVVSRKQSRKQSKGRRQRGGAKISFKAGEVIKVGTRTGTNLAKDNPPVKMPYPAKSDAQELTQTELNSLNLLSTIEGKNKSDLTFVMFPSGCGDILGVPNTLVNR